MPFGIGFFFFIKETNGGSRCLLNFWGSFFPLNVKFYWTFETWFSKYFNKLFLLTYISMLTVVYTLISLPLEKMVCH